MGRSLYILLILPMAIVSFDLEVNVVHEWRYCDYEWKSKQQKKDAINSGAYDVYTCILSDVDKAKDGRIFVTAPKFVGPGTPVTLATVTNKIGPGGPRLRPYPDWNWHTANCMCDRIVNIQKTHIQCNYLFALDNGKDGFDQVCNPKLLIFNLENDTLVETIYIPLDIATNQTGFGFMSTPLVYFPGKCTRFLDKMIIFMADMHGFGLVVYDSSTKRMCRVESDYMKPSTDTSYYVAGQNFTYSAGIFSLTIVRNDLYYASLTGKEIYKINIKTLLKCPNKKEANKDSKLVKKLPNHILSLATAEEAIFYSNIEKTSILGTNVSKKSGKKTVVIAQDSEKLQLVTGLKYSSDWDQLTYLSDRYHRFALGTVNLSEIHFRYCEMNLTEIREKTDLFSHTKNTKYRVIQEVNILGGDRIILKKKIHMNIYSISNEKCIDVEGENVENLL